MKITKLVILFNYKKIVLGLIVSALLFVVSKYFVTGNFVSIALKVFSFLIFLNILASLFASYILYDKSDLYELNYLKDTIDLNKTENAILIHASFDPLSEKITKKFPNLNLTVCDIYGNRHEHEKGIEISKKIFPPNTNEIKISPNNLPFENNSQNVILAITALHEILELEQRILFFKEAERILKKNGVVIISEQVRDTTNFLFFNIGAFHFLTMNQWSESFKNSGLKLIKNEKITPFANMMVLKKLS